ncbi:MAG: hypothetical protein ACP5LE_05470, partial [Thermoplasmata archaeon]
YWSNWDGKDWGTANAYPIDGGKASDNYPLQNPVVSEFSGITAIAMFCIGILLVALARKRKER